MSRSVVCYPQPGKEKSRVILEAFAAGCGGRSVGEFEKLQPGAAAFYGCIGIEHLLAQAVGEKREWFYGDNAFFDATRGKHFRFGKSALQISSLAAPDHSRLKALGLHIKPWRTSGRHIVIVEQSSYHLRITCGIDNWLFNVLQQLRTLTDRMIIVRHWSRDKRQAGVTLQKDLEGAHALITHTSAAANEALVAGVPAFVTGQCAASPLSAGIIEQIESPRMPEGREDWAAGLAGAQWTLEELRAGKARDYMETA